MQILLKMEGLIPQIISLVIVALLFASMLLTKKLHYVISGLALIAFGTIPILFELYIINLDITAFPIFNYSAYFFVVFAGKDLFKEAFKEKESKMKYPTMILAIVLITITTIPTLHKMGVTQFAFEYPELINHIIYIVSGIFLILGAFTMLRTED